MKRLRPLLPLILLLLAAPLAAQDGCVLGVDCARPLGVSSDVLAAYPAPNVIPLRIDDSVLYDRIYRKVPQGLELFDAPGGSLVSTTGGFSYVTIKETQGGWSRIDANRWVRTADLDENVLISRFAGVRLPEDGLPYPMAWTLRHLRASAAPGADESSNNPFMYRYTRVTLYTYVEIDGYRWYQIGQDQWVHQFNVAKIVPIERPENVDTRKWVAIDLYEQVLVAYEDEQPVYATLISSGLPNFSTNEGLFHVYLRYPRTTMSGLYQQPGYYNLQEVPWTMYFDGDIAIHGTYWHDGFGYRASRGCVNASIIDAKWLYDWAADEFTAPGDTGPAVYVYASGEYDA
jgi:hypothetical protein